jgi:prefoldin subunit 5
MNDKEIKYTIRWTQPYSSYLETQLEMIEQELDRLLELTEYQDAIEVINRIKSKL